MHATWTLTITLFGIQVSYRNLHDGRSMLCGTVGCEHPATALLDFMLREGSGGSETVVQEGKLVAFLLPQLRGVQ